MKVGVTQIVIDPSWSMEKFFTEAKRTGYDCVEICMRQTGELTPQTDEAALKQIRKQADAAGIGLASMCHSHVNKNILDSGDEQKAAIELTIAGLRAAAAMGIKCTLHTLGRCRSDLYYDVAYKNAIKGLKKVAKAAEKLKVTLAVEFVWSGFLFSPLEMKRFLDEIDSKRIGFYFDPGNMAVFQFPHHWVKIVGKHLKMVHLKDWKGGPLNGGWPPLTEGTVDYALMNKELRAIKYKGPFIHEVPPSDAPLEKSAEAIKRIIAM